MGDVNGAVFTLFGTAAGTVLLLRAVWVYQRYVESRLIHRATQLEHDLEAQHKRADELERKLAKSERDRRHAEEREERRVYELARAERQLAEFFGDRPRFERTRKTDPPPPVGDEP